MNQIFSLTRFGRLLRKYFADNRWQLLANMALLIGVFGTMSIFVYRGYPAEINVPRFALIYILGAAVWYIFIVQQTAILNQKERAINYLMQPAAQFEKIILIWLISGVGFILVYSVVITAIDAAGVWFANHRQWTPDQLSQIRRSAGMVEVKPWYHAANSTSISSFWWVSLAIFHAIYVMLSLFIRRYTFPLGVVITIAVITIGTLINSTLLQILTGNSTLRTVRPFAKALVESPDHTRWRLLELPQPLGDQLYYAVGITVAILLYITAYVRLKEREV